MNIFKPAREQATDMHPFTTRRSLLKLFGLGGIIVSLAIGACDFRKVEAQTETNSKKESNMQSVQSVTTIQQNIPPIDSVTPPDLETATFALG